jgi:hypothetical protein
VSSLSFSAHDLCLTRLCQASGCEGEAASGWALCDRCSRRQLRGYPIVLHLVEQPKPVDRETMLWCGGSCQSWKPDEAFSQVRSNGYRRGRHHECKPCASTRRRVARANRSPEARERERERDKIRHARAGAAKRAARAALKDAS